MPVRGSSLAIFVTSKSAAESVPFLAFTSVSSPPPRALPWPRSVIAASTDSQGWMHTIGGSYSTHHGCCLRPVTHIQSPLERTQHQHHHHHHHTTSKASHTAL